MGSLVQCEKVDCGGEILSEKIAQWLRCKDGNGDEKVIEGASLSLHH
jgi:hypothetical protein